VLNRREALRFAAASAGALWLPGCRHAPPDLPRAAVSPGEAGDITFFVSADPHFGAPGVGERNRVQIRAMNELPGTPLPRALGGAVARPIAVLMAGDLTEFGTGAQWAQYLAHYGPGGLLHYPVYECTGNHDRYCPFGSAVLDGVRARHGGLLYGAALGHLVVISLDLFPDAAGQEWLTRQLRRIAASVPIVLFFHYPLAGHFADWWSEDEKSSFAGVIRHHRIVAIFHGHAHSSQHYVWRGYDIYNVGSPKHSYHSFAVVRAAKDTLAVASWSWGDGRWSWSHSRVLAGSS